MDKVPEKSPTYLTDFGGSQFLNIPDKQDFPDAESGNLANASYCEYATSDVDASPAAAQPSPREAAIIESNRIALPKELTVRIERFKWNAVFQEYYDMMFKDAGQHFSVVTTALGRISSLYQDFLRTAVMYTKIIVNERFMDNQQKSIKPYEVGGIAGGDKYIVEGIFFKFAVDTNRIYGGVDNAAKSFGHELRSLSLLQNLAIDLLHVPLFVVIDYRGFRVAAQSLVPVGKAVHRDTLRFGSADAGHVIRDLDAELSLRFDEAGKMLNLARHRVGLNEKETLETRMPIDIEGHLGVDGRYYVLDAARLMPPEPPAGQGTHLYRLLRPELVRSFAEPLCSDSFANFISVDPQRREYSRAIKEAVIHLRETVIPKFAKWLIQNEEGGARVNLTQEMHDRGINMRCLGLVYDSCTSSAYWRCRLLTEMVLRVAKLTVRVLMRTAMEKIKLATHEPYVRVVVQYFNLLFGNSDESKEYWLNELSKSIRLSFYYHLEHPIHLNKSSAGVPIPSASTSTSSSAHESATTESVAGFPHEFQTLSSVMVDLPLLFRDLMPKCGIKLLNLNLQSINKSLLEQEQPFSETDFGETVPVQKNMDIVEYSSVYAHYTRFVQFGPRPELVEPILRKISANNTPGPFYVPYLAARACFALWLQLRQSSSPSSNSPTSSNSSASPQLSLSSSSSNLTSSYTATATSGLTRSSSGTSIASSGSTNPATNKTFKERLYSSSQSGSWGPQQTLENISLSLSYSNLPKLTTERFLSIFYDEVLFKQAKTRKPTIYKLLGKWAEACSNCGCDDLLGAILCCQVYVLRKLENATLAEQALKQLQELHPKIPQNGRLYKYYVLKLRMIGLNPEDLGTKSPRRQQPQQKNSTG